MDSFDKKVSNLYNEEHTSANLPEGFGWDEMSDGIYQKMEAPKKKRRFFIWWLVSGGLLIVSAALWFYFSNKTEKNLPTVDKIVTSPVIPDQNPENNKIPFNEKKNTKQIAATDIRSTKKETQQISTFYHEKNQPSAPISDTNLTTKAKTSFSLTESSSFQTPNTNRTQPKVDLPTDQKVVLPTTIDHVSTSTLLSKNKNISFLPVKFLPLKQPQSRGLADDTRIGESLNAEQRPFPRTINFRDDITNEEDKPLDNSKNQIKFGKNRILHIYGGTLFSSGKYADNHPRNPYSTWLPGYFAGLEFSILTSEKWSLNLGYEHKFAVQLFDFQNITDTIPTVVADVLTGIRTNSLNGTTSENRENISTRAVRSRNYLNYNTFRAHAFRLSLVRVFKIAPKFQLMTGMGTSYNFLNQTKGRTIDKDRNTLNYGSDGQSAIYRKQSWGVEGGFSMAYKIGKISLRGNFWIEKSLNYSMESESEIRPTFYKVGLGIGRVF